MPGRARPVAFGILSAAALTFPATAHEASSLDITNAIFASRDADCASYENRYSSEIRDTQQNKTLKGAVHVTAYNDHCVLESNNIPNHNTGEGSSRNFVAPVAEIPGTFTIPRNPKQQASATALDQRSYDAIHRVVRLLDEAALAERKRVSTRMARARLAASDFEGFAERDGDM